jgi:hypothetical protein
MVWYFEFSFSELGNFFLKKTMLPYWIPCESLLYCFTEFCIWIRLEDCRRGIEYIFRNSHIYTQLLSHRVLD